jgi:hypothetical protein
MIPNGVNQDAWKYKPDMTTPHPRIADAVGSGDERHAGDQQSAP